MSSEFYNGFDDLAKELENIVLKLEKPLDILEVGAKAFVSDLLKLPKPISKIRKAGYTHLINTFSYKKNTKDVEVGWGKYYGLMLENGTSKLGSRPHLKPLWEKNKDNYYKKMLEKSGLR